MTRFFVHMGLLILSSGVPSFSQQGERLSLKEAVTLAQKNNPLLRSSSSQIDVERGRFWRGISPPSPSVAVTYDYIPGGRSIKQFGERTMEINQSLDFPTNILLRGMQLSSMVSVAEAEHASVSIAVTARVKTAYYTVLARQKKEELAGDNCAIADEFARKAEIRYNIGEAANLERLTASVQRTQARYALETARNDLNIALGELYSLLGRSKQEQPDKIILTDSMAYRPIRESLEQLTEKARAANPLLRAASGRVSAASRGRNLAWSSFLPSINASYYRQTTGGNSDFYGVSLGLSVPLWFLFDQRGQIQEASAHLTIAESDFQSLNNFIDLDIKSAFLELTNNEQHIILHQSDILPQAEEVYRTAMASYEAGDITYIEFLQARQILISSRTEYIDDLLRYCSSLARLECAVGDSIH